MTVKAYIIDDNLEYFNNNSEIKCHIENNSFEDNDANTDNENKEKSSPELKFIVPGCITGNNCNNCGNCH
ncbi:hypothetical protein [Clostridium sp. AWRP]|uniref:hypothetical protein n=1 Tax=Clostridium sp. AWRP TaxID=2212991 RepID=UPI000FDC4749|nr:hypothetical protein [Clostridium sp. AWRP]AZV57665.1 hypothetical protein DMR38_14150 [Clostridium sp. AWRP]